MAVEDGDAAALERVPHVDRVVVVAGEEDASRDAKVDGVDAEDGALLGVDGHLAVGPQVEQPALPPPKKKKQTRAQQKGESSMDCNPFSADAMKGTFGTETKQRTQREPSA